MWNVHDNRSDDTSQDFAMTGTKSWAALSKSTRYAKRFRVLMSLDDVSLAMMPLNVRGPLVSPKTNRPPYLPMLGAFTTIGSGGNGYGSVYPSTRVADRRPQFVAPSRAAARIAKRT